MVWVRPASDQRRQAPHTRDQDLTTAIAAQFESGIEASGTEALVVAGGSIPKGLFKTLPSARINWSKVMVLLADDRWVA